jgi:hypothetical protein
MILITVYCAGRLALSHRWRRETSLDADGTHVAMGAAMAGMLLPWLSILPAPMWEAVFTGAAGWFAWQSIRSRAGHPPGRWRSPHPLPHLVECAAMLYMLLAAPGSRTAGPATGSPMPSMSGSSGTGVGFPALAVVLALFMVGYVAWASDQLISLARPTGTARGAAPDAASIPRTLATVAASGPPGAAVAAGLRAPTAPWQQRAEAGTWPQQPAASPMLAPRLAACYKIVMGITMAYMLILML